MRTKGIGPQGLGSPLKITGSEMPATVEDDYQEEARAGHVKHPTLTVDGKPLEYNPKFDPNKLITDQSEAADRKSLKSNKKKR